MKPFDESEIYTLPSETKNWYKVIIVSIAIMTVLSIVAYFF
jgi:hypothetical protein